MTQICEMRKLITGKKKNSFREENLLSTKKNKLTPYSSLSIPFRNVYTYTHLPNSNKQNMTWHNQGQIEGVARRGKPPLPNFLHIYNRFF